MVKDPSFGHRSISLPKWVASPPHRVVAHEARTCRDTSVILSSRPHHRALTEQLLGYLPQGPGGQVEHELFSAVADVEAVAAAGEIGIAADLGPLRF